MADDLSEVSEVPEVDLRMFSALAAISARGFLGKQVTADEAIGLLDGATMELMVADPEPPATGFWSHNREVLWALKSGGHLHVLRERFKRPQGQVRTWYTYTHYTK